MTEREMLKDYAEARTLHEECAEKAKQAKAILEEKESLLVNALNDKGASSTAHYDGLGKFILTEPKVYASYLKENEETVFEFLKKNHCEALIKPSVNSASLSTFVTALIKNGDEVPGFISYYKKESGRYLKDKKTANELLEA